MKASSLEIKFEKLLKSLSIRFKKQVKIGSYPVDFYLTNYKLSIQVDGCFHHLCSKCYTTSSKVYPRQKFQYRRDNACNLLHKYNKVSLIRFKECYINNNIDKIPEILYNIFNRIRSGEIVFEEYLK